VQASCCCCCCCSCRQLALQQLTTPRWRLRQLPPLRCAAKPGDTSMLRHCLCQIISLPGALHQAQHTSRRSSDRPSDTRGEAEQSAYNMHAAFSEYMQENKHA
jgi:hypothetical protein